MITCIKNENPEAHDLSQYRWYQITNGGNVLKLTAMTYKPRGGCIKNLPDGQYVDLRTGEIKIRQRNGHLNSIATWKERADNIIMLINNNFFSQENEFFITLTYKECMPDYQRCRKDTKRFIEKLLYYFPQSKYIAIPELQERGAWHIHMLFKVTSYKYLFINNDKIYDWWGHGFTSIERITSASNIGKYFISHDKMSLTIDALQLQRVRLPWKSKNVIKPKHIYVPQDILAKILNYAQLEYSAPWAITDLSTGEVVQEILKQEYILDDNYKHLWQSLLRQAAAEKVGKVSPDSGNTVQANLNKPCNK